MHRKQHSNQPNTRQDSIYLCILIAAALCVGVYLIATTATISNDSIIYVEYAQNFARAPITTMLENGNPPGYPVMILGAHKIAGLFSESESVFTWIRSAQMATLALRLLAIVMLYLLGKDLVGARFSFWGVLIIILLPKSAQYGSNALSDWPHLFFLVTGFFLLIRAATNKKLYLFALVGMIAGLGYLVRAECGQLVIYGLLWLGLGLLTGKMWARSKTVLAAVLLLVGFLIIAGPYMRFKAKPLPKKSINISEIVNIGTPKTAEGLVKLGGNIGDTLEWIFVPTWIIGLYGAFRKTGQYKTQHFFIITLIALNVALMFWLYTTYSYMDKRHTFPLLLFTLFYIPGGIELMASWLGKIKSKKANWITNNKQLVFYALLAIGIAVCIPQLLRPLNYEKLFLRKAAQWLAENTDKDDLVDVSDLRIAFYAQRSNISYDAQPCRYAAKLLPVSNPGLDNNDAPPWPIVFSLDSTDNKTRVIIYDKQH